MSSNRADSKPQHSPRRSAVGGLGAFWAVFRALVLSHLRHEKLRSSLALVGVCLGVGVVVAIGLANAATLQAFATTVDSVAGRAQLQVRGNGLPLDERLLADVQQFRAVDLAVPVISLHAGVEGAPGEVLTVLAVDVVNDVAFRDYQFEMNAEATLSVLLDARSIVLTQQFADRHGLAIGDDIALRVDAGIARMRIADLLAPSGPARAVDSNIAIMDIAAAQDRFGLQGQLDHIDILLRPEWSGADDASGVSEAAIERARTGLAAFLPDNVLVQRPAARGATVDKMLSAFHYNLEALGYVALIVGVFLIYNTVSVSVVRRRAEIGTLRALGVRRRTILAAFVGEGLMFGVPGALLGCIVGYLLAQGLVGGMSQAVSLHWIRVRIDGVAFDASVAARGSVVGVIFSLVAAWLPAREAGRVAPANTTRAGSLDTRISRTAARWLIPLGIAQLALAAWLATLPAVGGVPVWGFAAAFFIIFGFASLAPTVLRLVDGVLGPIYARVFGAEGILSVSFVEGARSRTTVAVTGLMIGLAMVISVGIMVGSFRGTVVQWLEQTVRADVLVKPASLGANANEALMSAALAERIAAVDGVADADLYRLWRIELNGRLTNFGGGEIGVFARHATLGFVGPSRDDRLDQLTTSDAVIVTETFAYRHGVAEGDTLELPVEAGTATFEIAGVYREYSSDLGYVMMDRSALLRHFPSMDSVNGVTLFLRDGADPDEVRARIVAEFGEEANLLVVTNREVRQNALEIFDQTFRVTHALILIAMVVSVLGVTNTLLAMIVDRRRELMTLRFVGMARGRVARVVMLESSLLSAAGIVLGLACGVALSFILIYVVNRQSFGWTIDFNPPLGTLTIATILLYAVSLLAGLLPAREASRVNMRYR